MRSQDGGTTWAVIGLNGTTRQLRGIAIDPANPATLYVASYGEGVWISHDANAPDPSQISFEQISGQSVPNSPGSPEELVVVSDGAGSTLYVSSGPASGSPGGGYSYAGGGWQYLTPSLPGAANWFAIDAYSESGVRHLVTGCRNGCPIDSATGVTENLFRSDDGGVTWTPLLGDPALIHGNEIGGPGGPAWWLAQASPPNMLGGAWYQVAQIRVDPTDHQRIFVAGRSGLWRSDDGGANWYPCVNGMLVTVATGVAVDPTNLSKVYASVLDWGMVYSQDRGLTVAESKPVGAGSKGEAVAVDPASGKVYLSLANSDETKGEVYSSTDPMVAGSWHSEKLSRAPGEGGAVADALAVDHAGKHSVIVAAVAGSGVWEKVIKKGGVWTHVLTRSTFGSNLQISWPHGSSDIYVYDPATGELWISANYGRDWGTAPIWTLPSPTKVSGFVGADPTGPTTVYVSTDTGLYKLTNTTGSLSANLVSTLPTTSPGPVTVDALGRVWVTGRASQTSGPGLWRSPDDGATWTSLSDDYYDNTAPFPWELAVAPDSYQYFALRGNGLVTAPPVQ
jgi:hypothetical protein